MKYIFQVVVEEIQIKSTDLGEIQKSGHDLMKALSGNVLMYRGTQGMHNNLDYCDHASCKMFICEHPWVSSNHCSTGL